MVHAASAASSLTGRANWSSWHARPPEAHAVAAVQHLCPTLAPCCAEMVHAASAAQRLFETPIPVSYTRHTSRSLMLWLLTLPFALWPIMGPSMVPACLFISYVSSARASQASPVCHTQKKTRPADLLSCARRAIMCGRTIHLCPACLPCMCALCIASMSACMCLAVPGAPVGISKAAWRSRGNYNHVWGLLCAGA